MKEDIDKFGLMWPQGLTTSHTTAAMVDTGEHWTEEEIILSIYRCLYISAEEPLVCKYRWGGIKHLHLPNLKASPVVLISINYATTDVS